MDFKSKQRPRAFMVLADGCDESRNGLSTYAKRPQLTAGWKTGKVVKVNDDKNIFLRAAEARGGSEDAFMHAEKISAHSIPLKIGDSIHFIPSDRGGRGPSVLKAKHSEFMPRSSEELKTYLTSVTKAVKSSGRVVLMEILPLSTQWKFIADSETIMTSDLVNFTLTLVTEANDFPKEQIYTAIEVLSQGKAIRKWCSEQSAGSMESDDEEETLRSAIKELCHKISKHFPELSLNILPMLKRNVEEDFVFNIMENMAKAVASKMNGAMNQNKGSDWKSLSFVPTTSELNSGIVEANKHLQPVHLSKPYKSPNDYMDVYYRLHRAEAFHAIQDAVAKLLSGEYDPRDFNVYHSVFFAGMEVTQNSICFALQFKSHRRVKKWEISRLLTYGNLLCISPGQRFGQDVIWATVSNRDCDVLNKSNIIFVELCDFNRKPLRAIIHDLQVHGGQTVMVESPTYFHSMRSVLDTLSNKDPEKIPLSKEIVSVEYDPKALPRYDLQHYLFKLYNCSRSEVTFPDISRIFSTTPTMRKFLSRSSS